MAYKVVPSRRIGPGGNDGHDAGKPHLFATEVFESGKARYRIVLDADF